MTDLERFWESFGNTDEKSRICPANSLGKVLVKVFKKCLKMSLERYGLKGFRGWECPGKSLERLKKNAL